MRFKTLLLVSIPLGRNPMWSVFKKSHFTRFYNCGGVRFWPNSHVRTDEMRLRKGLNTHRSRNTGTGRFESGTDLHGMDRSWPGKNYLNHMDRSWAESVHSMLLQVRAHARAFAKFANVLPISMQNKCYSRSICMPVWFSRGHGRDIKGHGMLFYMR